jgi:cysteinyl-tRNA synthetase
LTGENTILSKAFSASVARFFLCFKLITEALFLISLMMLLLQKKDQKTYGSYEFTFEIPVSNASTIDIATWRQSCYDAMNDDFNTHPNCSTI